MEPKTIEQMPKKQSTYNKKRYEQNKKETLEYRRKRYRTIHKTDLKIKYGTIHKDLNILSAYKI